MNGHAERQLSVEFKFVILLINEFVLKGDVQMEPSRPCFTDESLAVDHRARRFDTEDANIVESSPLSRIGEKIPHHVDRRFDYVCRAGEIRRGQAMVLVTMAN